jgi:uncharacterized protein (DUF1778 family)
MYDTWTLSEAASRAFIEALLDAPEPNAALRAAAERYKRRLQRQVAIEDDLIPDR